MLHSSRKDEGEGVLGYIFQHKRLDKVKFACAKLKCIFTRIRLRQPAYPKVTARTSSRAEKISFATSAKITWRQFGPLDVFFKKRLGSLSFNICAVKGLCKSRTATACDAIRQFLHRTAKKDAGGQVNGTHRQKRCLYNFIFYKCTFIIYVVWYNQYRWPELKKYCSILELLHSGRLDRDPDQ
jgi:hypothetical protein